MIEALGDACRVGVQQVGHNWDVVLQSDDPEGPHQMRVALRRLRCAMRAFSPYVDGIALQNIESQARDLGRLLSELRDADVLAADIVDAARTTDQDDSNLLKLRKVLVEYAAAHRQVVREKLTGAQWSAFRLQLLELPQEIDNSRAKSEGKELKTLAKRSLAKRWHRIKKIGRNLDQLTIEERHELRKRLKALRYTSELFASLFPQRDVLRYSNNLRRMQHQLGYLNDVAVATKLKSIVLDWSSGTPDLREAADQVIAWHAAQADAAWRVITKDWRKLSRSPKFWSR